MSCTGTLRLLAVVAAFSLVAACNDGEAPPEPAEPDSPQESAEPEPRADNETEQEAEMASEESEPAVDLERVVAAARLDLARRLGIEQREIELAEARAVTWPNGALGCPEEGGMYTQALVEGFFVRLIADGEAYPYHSGRDGKPFYCEPERSQPPDEDRESPPAS